MIKKILLKRYYLSLVFLFVLAIISSFLLMNKEQGNTVRISYNNEVIEELSLEENQIKTFEINNEYNTVEINNHKVSVTEANCDNQVCVLSKEILNIGDVIACLPHKFIIEII